MDKKPKKKLPKKVKIDVEVNIIDLLYKITSVYPPKALIKSIYMIYAQEGLPYVLSMMSLLAEKKDAENVEAALALTYLINNWDDAVKKGGEILKDKLDNKNEADKLE